MVCLGCLQMVFGGFRWFSEICNFNSYGEIRCFKFKTSRQLWEVFVAPSNNDAKVPLKQMSKFLGNSKFKVSLKKSLGGYKKFFLWKLTYIALCKFSRFWLRFSSFWGNFFKDLLIWLIIGWQVCIPGGVSDKYSIYCNLVVIIFSKFQQPIDIFKKSLPLLWKPQGKIKFLFIQEPWIYFLVKSRNSQIFYISHSTNLLMKYTCTC